VPIVPHEAQERIKHFRREGERNSVARDQALRGVQQERAEPVKHLSHQWHWSLQNSLKKFQAAPKDFYSCIHIDNLHASKDLA